MKSLCRPKNPRKEDVLKDVSSHLDRKFAELKPEERTSENFQAIFTQMGPTSDYAELLARDADLADLSVARTHLKWAVSAFICVAVAVVFSMIVKFYILKTCSMDK